MATIPFTDNYTDLASNRGFQFKFMCTKCGEVYLSTFQPNPFGPAAERRRRRFRDCLAAPSAALRSRLIP